MDDTQIYATITTDKSSSAITEPQKCLGSVQDWMAASKLKLNPEKREFIIFARQASLSHVYPVYILGNLHHPSSGVCKLGVLFDSGLSFSKQINGICKSCYYQMHNYARIQHFLKKSQLYFLRDVMTTICIGYKVSRILCVA